MGYTEPVTSYLVFQQIPELDDIRLYFSYSPVQPESGVSMEWSVRICSGHCLR